MKHKPHWLELAEVIDGLRVFPRIFLAACFVWVVDTAWILIHWYIQLPAAERGIEASGFASAVLLGEMAFLRLVYTTYSENSRDWNQNSGRTTVSSVTTQVTNP